MEFLYLLEDIRIPILDFFFSLITHIGEETFFLAIAIAFFWCIDKREGYYILITGLIGTVINQGLKLACRVDRPWVRNQLFKPVLSAVPEATGYSFPSGHTQNVAGTFGAIGFYSKRRSPRIVAALIIVLVSFSRMYLGVHTPSDVIASLAIAAILLLLLYPVFSNEESFDRYMPAIITVSALLSTALLLFTVLHTDSGVDLNNLQSARKNSSTLFGCLLGLLVVYPIEKRYIKFPTYARWYSQIIKLGVGLATILGMKAGLSSPLVSLFGNEYIARCIRYFIIVLYAGIIYPLTFKYFSSMRIWFLEKLSQKIKRRRKT